MLSSGVKSHAEVQSQRTKLTSSYNALLEEFASKDLHTVGNYALSHLIGKGSFGKVYLASHKLINGTRVVLKSAKKDDQNLAREIHHHRQFLHPHIARLYEVIVTESHVWLVLEFCPGDELYNHLIKNGPLGASLVQKIFAQLVGAVSYVHSKHCVHRDLKLENILLDKAGNVKLCDFGFTREYEGKASYLQTWCGTVCYSAPEMIKGEKYAGEKVDVWSLGIILFALLTGELPFDEGDDENATKHKILKEEPNYPASIPQAAKDLIISMLSKRPLLRPSLADLLTNPWLHEHAPQQQAILKLQQPPPFTTPLEKDTLQRMRSAGVDIDMVIENVLSQRCDSLAGWWGLLLEKEERKARRKDRKRKEKDAEAKTMRRISAASARLDRLAPTIMESAEESQSNLHLPDTIKRGREAVRSDERPSSIVTTPTLETKPSILLGSAPTSPPQKQARDRSANRSSSASRRRSQLGPPRSSNVRRNSTLHLVTSNPHLLVPESKQKRRRYQSPFMNQLVSFKHWIRDSARRSKSPNSKASSNHLRPDILPTTGPNKLRRPSPILNPAAGEAGTTYRRGEQSPRRAAGTKPRITTANSATSSRRMSHSPSPLTPSSSYRRASGLRGRKSTSSSVSSVRSFHGHHASHSKASSASSNSFISPPASAKSLATISGPAYRRASPHTSVRVLQGTPTSSSFPNNIRLVRRPPASLNLDQVPESQTQTIALQASPFSSHAPPSPGLVFQKRRRSPFKGPMLGPGLTNNARRRSEGGVSETRSSSGKGKSLVIEEEDEDGFEEVTDDALTPEDEHLAAGINAKLNDLAARQAQEQRGSNADPVTPVNENKQMYDDEQATPIREAPEADALTLKALEQSQS